MDKVQTELDRKMDKYKDDSGCEGSSDGQTNDSQDESNKDQSDNSESMEQ